MNYKQRRGNNKKKPRLHHTKKYLFNKKKMEKKMTNEIQIYDNNYPTKDELMVISNIARTAHTSGLYAGVGAESKILMILLSARELGIGPMAALNGGIWNIQGKIEISARLMNGMIRRAGHSISVIRSDDEICILKGKRKDGDEFECSFSMKDATKAGLNKKDVWVKYTQDMLYNRCMSRLGRRLFSDVIGQAYIEGEISELQNSADITVKDVAPQEPEKQETIDYFPEEKKQEDKMSDEQVKTLSDVLNLCSKEYIECFYKNIKQYWNVEKIEDILSSKFNALMSKIQLQLEAEKNVQDN